MSTDFDQPGSLHLRVMKYLKEDKRSLIEIHADSKLPFYWLKTLITGTIKNPSLNRMQALYEYYSGKPLNLD